MIKTIRSFIRAEKPILILLAGLFAYFLVQKLFRFSGFQMHYYDLYFYDHALWNAAQGRGLFLEDYNISLIWMHFYPIMWLLVPLYKLFPTPFWLFLFHTILLILMAFPILKLGQKYFGKRGLYITFLVLFLYLPFRRANFHDLHGEILMATLLSWLIYYLDIKQMKRAILLSVLLLFTKETGFLITVSFALYLIVFQRDIKRGVLLGVVAMAWGLSLVGFIMPSHLPDGDYSYLTYYDHLGDGLGEKLFTVVFRPDIVLKTVFQAPKIAYILLILLPLGAFALASPILILSVGTFAQSLLSNKPGTIDILSHYSIPLVPIMMMGGILGLFALSKSSVKWVCVWRRVGKGAAVFFMVVNVLAIVMLDLRSFMLPADLRATHRLLESIPPDASVVASSALYVHLEHRDGLTLFPNSFDGDFVVVQKMDPFFPANGNHNAYIADQWKKGHKTQVINALLRGERAYTPTNRRGYAIGLAALEANPNLIKVAETQNVVLYQKK
ncbi:MAG: DUF2079 domain-containing protein [bacterium]|nr:DUF2079 domain-containing protein [bacterium]